MNINRNEFCRVGVTKPPVWKIPRIVCSLNRTLTITFWKQKKTDASRTIRKPSTVDIDHEVQSDSTEGMNWTGLCLQVPTLPLHCLGYAPVQGSTSSQSLSRRRCHCASTCSRDSAPCSRSPISPSR
jgi:hypothetical protein